MDGWSFFVCLEELGALYSARRRGESARLPAPGARYADYVRWQAALLRGPRGAELTAYWRRQLGGDLPPLGLTTDRPRPPMQTFNGDRHAFGLGAALTGRLRALAEEQGTTLFPVLMTGFMALLFRYTGQPDLRVASQVAHREQGEFANVVGCFADSTVIRADLTGTPSFRSLLDQVSETSLAALEHQELPFSAVVEALPLERDPSRPPLCDVGFILQKSHLFQLAREVTTDGEGGVSPFGVPAGGEEAGVMVLGELTLQTYPVEQSAARYDLELQMIEAGGSLSAVLTYNTDLFDRETVARMGTNLVGLLEQAVVVPDTALQLLPVLSLAERRQLLSWGCVQI
jgi:non-ribosomal peptide synthetase component F